MGMHRGGFGRHPGASIEKLKVRKYTDRELIGRLVRYGIKYRGLLVLAVVCLGITSFTTFLVPVYLQIAIDNHILVGDFTGLFFVSGIIFGLNTIAWFSQFGQMYTVGKMGQNVIFEIRQDMFHHLQILSPEYFDRNESGQIISRVLNDVDTLSRVLSSGLVQVIGNILTLGILLIGMFWISIQLALSVLVVVPFLLGLALLFRKMFRKYFAESRRTIGVVTAVAQESILGIRVSKAFNHESADKEKFEKANTAYTRAMINVAKGISWFYPTVEFVMTIGTALIFYIVGINYSIGTMSLGLLLSFPIFLTRIFRPLQFLANFYTDIQNAITAGERIFQVLDEKPKVTSPKRPKKFESIIGKISFKNVTFGYEPKQPVLHNVSFTIEPGETIALVGYTGGGKTTIGNLLCRFYDPWQGSIEFDDKKIKQLDLDKVQKQIAVVLQEPFLFAGSLRENIKYGQPEATDADIWEVLKVVGLKDFVEGLPEGLNTNVQERGIQLSSGQRQLVSFARALIANPPILILDEATSRVDLYTESLIQEALEKLLKNRTSVVIAHRLSTIRNASRIFVVDEGKIVDIGTHDDLVTRKGIYRDLYKIQFKDNVPDLKVREERAFSKERKEVKVKAPTRAVSENDMGG